MTADPQGTLELLCESLKACGAGRITLRGESMHPTLQDGWKLHVRSAPAAALRVGDIGVFIHSGVLTVHRLIWKKRTAGAEKLVFQGDNNAVRELVAPEAVLGKVEAAEVERTDGHAPLPFPVGSDTRAWFYRSLYRIHAPLQALLPGSGLPEDGEPPGPAYRLLRALFRVLEPVFSPRPRR